MNRFALLLLVLTASTAHAQTPYTNILRPGMGYSNMAQAHYAFLSDQITRQQWARQSQTRVSQLAQPGAMAGNTPPAAAPRAPLSASDFRPSGPRDAAQQLVAAVPDAAGRASFVNAGRQMHNIIEAAPGFRKNNLAAAMTLLVGASLQVLGGREIDDATTEGLMRLINDDLVEAGVPARLSAEQRTRAYDGMLLVGGLILGLASRAEETGDPSLKAQAHEMANGALASLGLTMAGVSSAPTGPGAGAGRWGLWQFAPPQGQATQGPEVMAWQLVKGRSFCQFALYAAMRAEGDARAAFAAEWAQLARARGVPSTGTPAPRAAPAPNGWARQQGESDEHHAPTGSYRVRQATFSGHGRRMSAVATGNDSALCGPLADHFLGSLVPLVPQDVDSGAWAPKLGR